MANNYVLGRGKVFLSRLDPTTKEPLGFRYIGNTPEFSLTIEQEELEHFSSDAGIREKDDSISLQVTRSGSLSTDNIVPDNVALFFFGSKSVVADAGEAIVNESHTGVQQGYYYQLGMSVTRPSGARGLAGGSVAPVVTDGTGVTTYNETTDYTVNLATGQLYIVPGGAIADGSDILVDYTILASTRDRVVSGSQPVECAIQFIAENAKGADLDYYMPYAQIAPNGDYALKGDEWQSIPFSLEVLKRDDREAIYCDGRVAFV